MTAERAGWAIAVLAGSALVVAGFLPLAPPVFSSRPAPLEIHGDGFRADFRFEAPSDGPVRLGLRSTNGSKVTAGARVRLSGAAGKAFIGGSVAVPPGADGHVAPVSWDFTPGAVSLSRGHSYVLRVEGAQPGYFLEGVEAAFEPCGYRRWFPLWAADVGTDSIVLRGDGRHSAPMAGVLPSGPGPDRLVQTFVARQDGLSGVTLNLASPPDYDADVRITVSEGGAPAALWHHVLPARVLSRHPGAFDIRFPAVGASRGRKYAIELDLPADPRMFVGVSRAGAPADVSTSWNGRALANSFLFVPRYLGPWSVAPFAALLLLPLLLALGFRGPKAGLALAPAVVLLVSVVGLGWWQRDYSFGGPDNWIPDGYDAYATRLADLFSSPGAASLGRLHTFLASFPHAHSPLVPALAAAGMCASLPMVRAFLLVSFLATCGAGFLLLRILMSLPFLSWQGVWAMWGIGVTHFLFLKGALRPSTDSAGYLFVVAGLLLGLRLLRDPSPSWRAATPFLLVVTLGLFSRPSLLPLPAGIAAALVLAAAGEFRSAARRIPVAAVVGLAPPLVFFGVTWAAGYFHSFHLAAEKMREFASGRSPLRFLICLAVLVQLLAIPIALASRRGSRGPEWLTGMLTAAATMAFVALTATYWNRHFLPALPALLLGAAAGFGQLAERTRWLSALFWTAVLSNLAWAALVLHQGFLLAAPALLD